MTYKLFIDDERFPPKPETDWVVVRSYNQAVDYMSKFGYPTGISFDHDLGDNVPSGFDIAKWMVETSLDQAQPLFPLGFDFYVHSQNPVGAENIRQLLTSYLKYSGVWS